MTVRVKMNPAGVRKLRYSPAVARALEGYGRRLMTQCNAELGEDGYKMSSQPGERRPSGRHRVTVMAVSTHARRHDRRHNTLIKQLGQLG